MSLRPGKRRYQILMCTISNKILMDCMLYFGEAITEFFGLVICDNRRVCFYNVNDLNDKPHPVRKGWC